MMAEVRDWRLFSVNEFHTKILTTFPCLMSVWLQMHSEVYRRSLCRDCLLDNLQYGDKTFPQMLFLTPKMDIFKQTILNTAYIKTLEIFLSARESLYIQTSISRSVRNQSPFSWFMIASTSVKVT